MDQVRLCEQCDCDEIHPLSKAASQIPGMVNKYHDAHQVLYICFRERQA